MKKAALIVSLLILMSCGGGDYSTPQPIAWTGSVNSAGYPDVTGFYSFNAAAGETVCSDGSKEANPPMAMNFQAIQVNNQVLLINTASAGLPAGWTVLSGDNLDGNVDPVGNFTIDQHIIIKIASSLGNNTFIYTIAGTFNPGGWTGTYQASIHNDFYKVSCSYSAPFSGGKIAQAPIKSPSENEKEMTFFEMPGMTWL